MVYLLPISHDVQLGHHHLSESYKSFLENKINTLKISLICEELSSDDIKTPLHKYIARDVANSLKVDYVPCEPTDKERNDLEIPLSDEIISQLDGFKDEALLTGRYPVESFKIFKEEMTKVHLKREEFWMKKIEGKKNKTILFIAGVGHFSFCPEVLGEGFDKLLTNSGFKTGIISTDFVNSDYLL